jgi:hypothetical protein
MKTTVHTLLYYGTGKHFFAIFIYLHVKLLSSPSDVTAWLNGFSFMNGHLLPVLEVTGRK